MIFIIDAKATTARAGWLRTAAVATFALALALALGSASAVLSPSGERIGASTLAGLA